MSQSPVSIALAQKDNLIIFFYFIVVLLSLRWQSVPYE